MIADKQCHGESRGLLPDFLVRFWASRLACFPGGLSFDAIFPSPSLQVASPVDSTSGMLRVPKGPDVTALLVWRTS